MHDVCAVVAHALLDKRLGPDHLFRRYHRDDHPEHVRLRRVVEPQIVDSREAVPGAVDHVDEVLTLPDLREPMGKRVSVVYSLAANASSTRGQSLRFTKMSRSFVSRGTFE